MLVTMLVDETIESLKYLRDDIAEALVTLSHFGDLCHHERMRSNTFWWPQNHLNVISIQREKASLSVDYFLTHHRTRLIVLRREMLYGLFRKENEPDKSLFTASQPTAESRKLCRETVLRTCPKYKATYHVALEFRWNFRRVPTSSC